MCKKTLILAFVFIFALGAVASAATPLEQSYTATIQTEIKPHLAVGLLITGDLADYIENGNYDYSTTELLGSFWVYDEENPAGNLGTINVDVDDRYVNPYGEDQFDAKSPLGMEVHVWSNLPVSFKIDKPDLHFQGNLNTGNANLSDVHEYIEMYTEPTPETPGHGSHCNDPYVVSTDNGDIELVPFWYKPNAGGLSTINYFSWTVNGDEVSYYLPMQGQGVAFVIPFYPSYYDDDSGDHWIHYPAGTYEADWTVTIAQQAF